MDYTSYEFANAVWKYFRKFLFVAFGAFTPNPVTTLGCFVGLSGVL